jgi:hypothetical protein
MKVVPMSLMFLVSLFCVVYYFPTFVAARRGHKYTEPLIILNCLVAWTGVGWFLLLLWALAESEHTTSLLDK